MSKSSFPRSQHVYNIRNQVCKINFIAKLFKKKVAKLNLTWKQPQKLRAERSFSSSCVLLNDGDVKRPISIIGMSMSGREASRLLASLPL